MTTAQAVLQIAQDNLDLYEQPPGSNHVPGVTDRNGFWDDAWCDMYVSKCFEEAGLPIHFASCYYSRRAYEAGEIGTWLGKPDISEIRPGDQVLYGSGGSDHTGLVAAVDVGNGQILTYEGNWGDRSLAQWRGYDDQFVYGFGRPNYDGVPTPPPTPTPQDPADYTPNGDNPFTPLYVDGVPGALTWSAVQWSLNDSNIDDIDGFPVDVDGDPGRSTYSSLQRYLGAVVDGELGPETTRALQHHVGVTADGQLGPITVKALQQALNGKTF